jgi:hypothetical protein
MISKLSFIHEVRLFLGCSNGGVVHLEDQLFVSMVKEPENVKLTLVANRKEVKDSWRWAASGDRLRTIYWCSISSEKLVFETYQSFRVATQRVLQQIRQLKRYEASEDNETW